MCGIIGYVGRKQAMPILIQALLSMEYRGYDSAGVALLEQGQLRLVRAQGKMGALIEKIGDDYGQATVGIGHTRWATHGVPSEINAHPHFDCQGDIALLHNGIIENYLELKEWLIGLGHVFSSDTDTEVVPHLLEHYYEGDLGAAMRKTVQKLRGAYALVAICRHEPRKLVAARQDSPLIVGLGENEYFFASDMAALVEHTREMMVLQNGDVAELSDGGVTVYHNGHKIGRKIMHVDWDKEAAQKGGYPHYMIKEIHEQGAALRQSLRGRAQAGSDEINFDELNFSDDYLRSINKIAIVACGTAYHAGLVGKHAMEKLLKIPVEVDVASEYRYRDLLVDERTLVIVVSQSGETADTLAALRVSKQHGATVLAICNVVASSIALEADQVLFTYAGPEKAVASTKAYSTQLMVLYMLAIYLASYYRKISAAEQKTLIDELCALPDKVQLILDSMEEKIKELTDKMFPLQQFAGFFIGRGMDNYVGMEGALKLKEISYIHAQAYAAGELKHGTIALIEPDMPVLAICTQRPLLEKMISNIRELQARAAYVAAIAFDDTGLVEQVCDQTLLLPGTVDLFSPVLSVVPLQILAYYAAYSRGCDVDQPRNLAKSVTVE
ncbi:MAG: glutamine--fructose-6-phosphate transaminase (isomerizing) [Clostridiales bacterium]|nr:glutamine--fructose-6-phosphate transaminase (isomerizing) [Clostridiales bacterium]